MSRPAPRTAIALAAAGIVAAALLAVPRAPAQDDDAAVEPGEPSLYGSFAFSDASGTFVLALSPLANPRSVQALITQDGRRLRVEYQGEQKATAGGDGRDAARNFASLAGQRFRIVSGRVGSDENCFLAAKPAADLGPPAALKRDVRPCAPADSVALESRHQRTLAHCWSLASAEPHATVHLYEVAPSGPERVAGIAVFDGRSWATWKYRAKVSEEDPSSVWRVGDEGQLSPQSFDVLFMLRAGKSWLIGVAWYGEEGTDLNLYRTGEGGTMKSVAAAYRYLAPF